MVTLTKQDGILLCELSFIAPLLHHIHLLAESPLAVRWIPRLLVNIFCVDSCFLKLA